MQVREIFTRPSPLRVNRLQLQTVVSPCRPKNCNYFHPPLAVKRTQTLSHL
jgi:hypothetical protein